MMPGPGVATRGQQSVTDIRGPLPRLATEPKQRAPRTGWFHPAGQGPWEASCGCSRPGCEFRFLHSELHDCEHSTSKRLTYKCG